jgi:hypothetical protein
VRISGLEYAWKENQRYSYSKSTWQLGDDLSQNVSLDTGWRYSAYHQCEKMISVIQIRSGDPINFEWVNPNRTYFYRQRILLCTTQCDQSHQSSHTGLLPLWAVQLTRIKHSSLNQATLFQTRRNYLVLHNSSPTEGIPSVTIC